MNDFDLDLMRGRSKKTGLPLCEVTRGEGDTVPALFHGWESWATVHQAYIKGEIGGQISQAFGLCEDRNGAIKRINPYDIRFIRE